jgi:hypothetical protein
MRSGKSPVVGLERWESGREMCAPRRCFRFVKGSRRWLGRLSML